MKGADLMISNKMLVAFDGSDNSVRAADYAFYMARFIPNTEIEIVFVLTYTLEEARFLGASPEMYKQTGEAKAEDINTKILDHVNHGGISFKLVVLDGDPADVIVNHAKCHDPNQIVIGSKGWGKIKRLLLGSISQKVVQDSPCTVTVVK